MRWLSATATIEIERPIEEVWGFVADLENMPHWVKGVSEPALTSDPPLAEGSAFTSLYTYARRTHQIDYEVTAFDAPRRYAVKSTGGPYPFEGALDLASAS